MYEAVEAKYSSGTIGIQECPILGTSKFIETDEDVESAHKTYIHMKLEVNIELPVIAGFWWINSSGEEQCASIKYERLFEFCYGCRRLGHTSQVCREEVTISKVIYEHPMYG